MSLSGGSEGGPNICIVLVTWYQAIQVKVGKAPVLERKVIDHICLQSRATWIGLQGCWSGQAGRSRCWDPAASWPAPPSPPPCREPTGGAPWPGTYEWSMYSCQLWTFADVKAPDCDCSLGEALITEKGRIGKDKVKLFSEASVHL